MISIVVAVSENQVIGKDNRLLWRLSNDMKFFKNLTMGGVLIMGRKTFESIGKALPGRENIIITRQKDWTADQAIVTENIEDAMTKARATEKDIFIIGGGEIYKQTLDKAERIYLTRVHTQIEGDTFFPTLDESIWTLKNKQEYTADEKNEYAHSVEIWERV
jgi:dihydrofolate reductase